MAGFTHAQVKLVQIVVVVVTALIGVISVVLLSKVSSHFQDNCFLYAKLQVKFNKVGVVSVGVTSTWGEQDTCNFATFEGLVVFVASFVWFWFYLHMSFLSKDSSPEDVLFVVPRILINSVLCLVSIVRAGYVTAGYSAFCDDISICTSAGKGQQDLCRHSAGTCTALQTSKWDVVASQKTSASLRYDDVMHAAISLAWLEPVALALNVIVVVAEVYLLTSLDQSEKPRSNRAFGFDSVTGSHTALWVNNEGQEESDDSGSSAASDLIKHENPESTSSSRELLCGDTAPSDTASSVQGKSASLEKSLPVPRLLKESGAEPGGCAQWSGNSQPSEQSGQMVVGPDDVVVNFPPQNLADPPDVSAVIISPSTEPFPAQDAQTNGKKRPALVSNV